MIHKLFGRRGRTPRPTRLRDGWTPRLETLEGRETPSIAYTVDAAGDALLRFDTANTTATTSITVTGMASGDVLDGLTFRTQTGQLFGVTFNSTTHTGDVGTINLSTGAFTPIGAGFSVASGTTVSLANDPLNDRLLVVTDTGISLTVNPNTGAVQSNTDIAGNPDIAGIAFSNNFPGTTSTTAFGIDVTNNRLVTIDTTTGAVTGVGSGLGVGTISAAGGMAIQSDGTALAELTVTGTSGLYSIDLSAGTATLIGNIGSSAQVTSGLALAPISLQISASGPGMTTTVNIYNADGTVKASLTPLGSFTGGATVAIADVNGDGIADYVIGAAAGGGPRVVVIDGQSGAQLASFFAFDPGFTGGVYVAAGDVNGDGKADIIIGAGGGGGPRVIAVDATKLTVTGANGVIADSSLLASFFAYNTSFHGGVRVAAADLTLSGGAGVPFVDEIITGAGPGGGPHVRVWTGGGVAWSGGVNSFFAYGSTFTGGVFVAAGDVNGDGLAEIITGAGAGGGPHVKVIDPLNGATLQSFFAFNSTFTGGVNVGVADVNGDGRLDIVAGGGAGQQSTVNVFDGTTLAKLRTYTAFDPTFLGGVFVGGDSI